MKNKFEIVRRMDDYKSGYSHITEGDRTVARVVNEYAELFASIPDVIDALDDMIVYSVACEAVQDGHEFKLMVARAEELIEKTKQILQ